MLLVKLGSIQWMIVQLMPFIEDSLCKETAWKVNVFERPDQRHCIRIVEQRFSCICKTMIYILQCCTMYGVN